MVNHHADKILSWRATLKRVTWQLISKFLCLLSVGVTRWSSNAILGPVETHKLSFRSCIISYRLFALAKTDAENCNTYPRLQTDSSRFAFHFCGPWDTHQESYLPVPRLCKTWWNITVSLINPSAHARGLR